MGGYDTAQVCVNGHLINNRALGYPARTKKYCDKCGAKTVMECASCNDPIRGSLIEGFSLREDPPPSYCHNCGAAYPWTEASLHAAKDMARELEGLSEEERETLAGTLDDLTKDTPRTELAGLRFKNLIKKATAESGNALRQVLLTIGTEAAKRQVFGP